MSQPRLLDACCCAGAASHGYHLAGFEVVGVDIAPQPDYPFEFYQGDAVQFIRDHGHEFAVIAGSPPCQQHTRLKHYNDTSEKRAKYDAKWVNLIPDCREAMRTTGKPYIIENVEEARAELIDPIKLCGHMFGLKMYRHRLFESNMDLVAPDEPKPYHPHLCARNGYLPTEGRPFMSIHGGKHSWAWQRRAAIEMGAGWIGRRDYATGAPAQPSIRTICEAIPPAYTEFLGRQLMTQLEGCEAA